MNETTRKDIEHGSYRYAENLIAANVGWVATKSRDSLRGEPREKSSEQRDTHRSL